MLLNISKYHWCLCFVNGKALPKEFNFHPKKVCDVRIMIIIDMPTGNLEYSVHFLEDIRRHSRMNNYSCEMYERAILSTKTQKLNTNGLEKTFAV